MKLVFFVLLLFLSTAANSPVIFSSGGNAKLIVPGDLLKADGTTIGGTSITIPTCTGAQRVTGDGADLTCTATIPTSAAGEIITGNGTTLSSGYDSPAGYYHFRDEFESATSQWTSASSGTGAGPTYANHSLSGVNHPSTSSLSTGTDTTGVGSIRRGQVWPTGGVITIESDIFITSLSTAGEEYDLMVGICDDPSSSNCSGYYFKYNRNASTNWLRCSRLSSETCTSTGVAAGNSTWYKLKIVVNALSTSAEYFINGTSVGSNTTNLPDGSFGTQSFILIEKSAGSTARLVHMDYYDILQQLTNVR